ncbi:hypothetical protein AURDEDRAFT_170461 [Auricularia subglabra TFB-10046 SS5]|nr:hypothetical protein AURDEDRAFT_170461 [Auricularia subglabra TFB-10046 SS5]
MDMEGASSSTSDAPDAGVCCALVELRERQRLTSWLAEQLLFSQRVALLLAYASL